MPSKVKNELPDKIRRQVFEELSIGDTLTTNLRLKQGVTYIEEDADRIMFHYRGYRFTVEILKPVKL